MNTTILQLENHDTLVSIRDRMDWAKTPRILLVWPPQSRVPLKPVELTLLQRHAAALGAELGLVVTQGDMRRAARGLGLPVFKKVADAQRSAWETGEASPVLPPAPRNPVDVRAMRNALPEDPLGRLSSIQRLGFFSAGVLAMLLVLLVFFPSAELRLHLPEQTQRISIPVTASAEYSRLTIAGELPVQTLTVTVQGSDRVKSSGQVTVPGQAAMVNVTITNLTEQVVFVPAGTILLTRSQPAVRFGVMQDVSLQPGEALDVPVRAVNAGAAGNVPPGTIVAFEGPLGLQLTASNALAATGGEDLVRPSPTEADRRALRAQLEQSLLQQARALVERQLRGGDVLIPTSLRVINVLDETYEPAENQPALEATLQLHLEVQASYVSVQALEQLASLGMDATLPDGFLPVPGSLRLEPSTSVFANDLGVARWQLQASRTLRRQVDPEQVVSLVMGKTTWQAAEMLQQTLGLDSPPEIGMTPPGWPWLPWLPVRISVVTQ